MKDIKRKLKLEDAQNLGSNWTDISKTGIQPVDSFQWISLILDYIETGDVMNLQSLFEETIAKGLSIPVGKMSFSSLRQTRYVAILMIAGGVHSAIKGGYNQVMAYMLSDHLIQKIDVSEDEDFILSQMVDCLLYLVKAVQECQKAKINHPTIRLVIDYIQSHLGDSLSLEIIADNFDISPTYLSTLFHQECGISLTNYIRKLRIKTACVMFDHWNYSQTEVAAQLGFCSQSYFIHTFKKELGITPREYITKQ